MYIGSIVLPFFEGITITLTFGSSPQLSQLLLVQYLYHTRIKMRFVCLFLVTSLLTRTVTANVFNSQHPSLTCPNAEGSNDFFNEGMVNLDISNGICTLVRIAPDGKSFKPMGRSYEGHPWEASAGEFKSLTFECNTSSCTVNLPALPTGAVYQLTTFDTPNYSDRDIKARFLEQSTFGPTRSDIGYFNGVDTMDFALWIEQQQQQSTMSSHRQFYRSRANTRQEVAVPQGAVTYPCQKGAVYRRFALSSKDSKKQLEIETSETMRILRVDGFVRTVVEGPVHWREDASVTFDDGSYEIEWQLRPSNKIGGILFLRHPGQNKLLEVSFGGHHGNPPIQFSLGEVPNVQVGIANNAARPIDTKYFQREDESVQEIILTKALTDYKCPYMRQTGNPTNPVFASFYGVYWIHDPRFVSELKTLICCMITFESDILLFFRSQSTILWRSLLQMVVEVSRERPPTLFTLNMHLSVPTLHAHSLTKSRAFSVTM